jgi:hypothetical protein
MSGKIKLNGVTKSRKRFRARIKVKGKIKSLGTSYGKTTEAAAIAYDRAVDQHKLPSSKLNVLDGQPNDNEVYNLLRNPTKKRRLLSTNTSGYTGVSKDHTKRIKNTFRAQIKVDGKKIYLGLYKTAIEAALAYDRAVIQHKRPSSKLNFPNDYTTTSDDDESSDKESDDNSSSSSSSSDSCHSSDDDDDDENDAESDAKSDDKSDAKSDDKSDNGATLESSSFTGTPAQPHFERDPMLDLLYLYSIPNKNSSGHLWH